MRLAILPQALRIAIPAFVSIAVGFFQDTSLVVIIGLFDLLNTARVATQDPAWLGFHREAYAFVALIYFSGSAALSRYGLALERRMSAHRQIQIPTRPADRSRQSEGDDRITTAPDVAAARRNHDVLFAIHAIRHG
jgi:hypothetical protein